MPATEPVLRRAAACCGVLRRAAACCGVLRRALQVLLGLSYVRPQC
jgi:hypothetical protein